MSEVGTPENSLKGWSFLRKFHQKRHTFQRIFEPTSRAPTWRHQCEVAAPPTAAPADGGGSILGNSERITQNNLKAYRLTITSTISSQNPKSVWVSSALPPWKSGVVENLVLQHRSELEGSIRRDLVGPTPPWSNPLNRSGSLSLRCAMRFRGFRESL